MNSPYRFFTLVAALLAVGLSAHAASYTFLPNNTTVNWDAVGTWNSGYPSLAGDVAYRVANTNSATVTQNVSGANLGGIISTAATANTWTFALSNALTLNNNGAGAFITREGTNVGGRISFSGAGGLVLADNLTITNSSGTSTAGSIQISTVISGNGNITINNDQNSAGAGQVVISNSANTFTGSVTVARGAVTFNNNSSFGNSANHITLGSTGAATLTNITTLGMSLANNITVGTGGATIGATTVSTSASTFAGTITLNGALTTQSMHTGTGSIVLSNVVSGSGSLTVGGTGATRLTNAANIYTGETRVSAGTLLLVTTGTNNIANSSGIRVDSGSIFDVSGVTGTGGFKLASGQILSGNGTINGQLTVGSGAILAPGASPGTLTFNNNLILADGSISNFEINGLTAGLYDLAQSGVGVQSVTFDGTLNLNFQAGFSLAGGPIKLFDFDSYSGAFDTVNINGLAGGYSASFDAASGELTVTAVPEPSTWALLGLGLGVVILRARSRKRSLV